MRCRSFRATVCTVALLTTAPGCVLEAQAASLSQCVRARIRAPESLRGRVTGVVIRRTADSLTFLTEIGVAIQLPMAFLTEVDVSEGRSRARGAFTGALWGGGVGALSGLMSDSGSEQVSRGEAFAYGVAGGAMLGAIIGAFVQSEHWVRLPLPLRSGMRLTPVGPVVSLGFRF